MDSSSEIKDMRKSVLKAKLMTILPTYNDKARELLEKVVKRDPTDFEGKKLKYRNHNSNQRWVMIICKPS